ncbi:ferritin-like domain-containing protein [soil metagenome]
MSNIPIQTPPGLTDEAPARRTFFKVIAGAGLASIALPAVVALPGCSTSPTGRPGEVVLDFSDDFGVLNYALALEQLEYGFYEQVRSGSYFQSAPAGERQILQDLRDHELAHVDFLVAAISALGGTPIGQLQVNFAAVDFSSRSSVLGTARAFEDLGVSAYNGAGQYLTNPDLLEIAGKIVSVEARHASAIRDLIAGPSDRRAFAGDDIIDANGLDVARTPQQVLAAASDFVRTTIELRNVPS